MMPLFVKQLNFIGKQCLAHSNTNATAKFIQKPIGFTKFLLNRFHPPLIECFIHTFPLKATVIAI